MMHFEARGARAIALLVLAALPTMLRDYVHALVAHGIADVSTDDADTSIAMLMSTLWGDSMCRDMMPDGFPPADEAPARYVRVFLRAVGARPAKLPSARNRPALVRGRRSAP